MAPPGSTTRPRPATRPSAAAAVVLPTIRSAGSPTKAVARLGGSVLRVYVAVFFVLSGVAYLAGPPGWRTSPSYNVIAEWAPLRAWGAVLVVVGVAHLVAFVRRLSWAFDAAVRFTGAAVAAIWAVALVDAAFVHEVPGVVFALLWGLLAVVEFALAEGDLRAGR